MIKVIVCIGSSCHIKGSRQVVEGLQYLINEHGLKDKVELGGTFCMGRCQEGVCVTVDDAFFSVSDTIPEINVPMSVLSSALIEYLLCP